MSKLRKDIERLTLAKKKRRDYDPEDEPEQESNEDVSDSDHEDSLGGREHYEQVGKSRLRKPEKPVLDSKYEGVAVSKHALDAEDSDDDPFALQPTDQDHQDPFADAPTASEELTSGGENDDEDIGSISDEDHEEASLEDTDGSDDLEDDEEDDDQSEDQDSGSDEKAPISSRREQAAASLREQSQNLLAGLSQSASTDVKKGQAVKSQYQTFDRLLDSRMKLQKSLTTSGTIEKEPEFAAEAEKAIQNAQDAAIQLFNTISTFRESMLSASAPKLPTKKRKRVDAISDINDLPSMWSTLEELENESTNIRRATIDKWSNKAKASDPSFTAATAKPKFLDSTAQNRQLTAILDTFVTNEQHKHFQPLESESSTHDHASLVTNTSFDDSAFYQSLLRDLITSRAATSSTANDLSVPALPLKLHPSGNKENKKTVDTKASKGRKVRYTVHEKLQNFMAAEGDTGRDTAMWTERGKREFFGSLFGQHNVLREDSDEDMEDNADNDVAEIEALRLFRT